MTRLSFPPRHQRRKGYLAKATFRVLQVLPILLNLCTESVLITDHLFILSPPIEKIKQTAGITAVFVNVERLSPLSEVRLSEICSLAGCKKDLCIDRLFHSHRRSWKKPGGLKCLTDTQWSSTFSVATPGLRKQNYRFL